jgi:hypothetical protein
VLLGWASRADLLGEDSGKVTVEGVFKPFALVGGRAVATWRLDRSGRWSSPSGRSRRRPPPRSRPTGPTSCASSAEPDRRTAGAPYCISGGINDRAVLGLSSERKRRDEALRGKPFLEDGIDDSHVFEFPGGDLAEEA